MRSVYTISLRDGFKMKIYSNSPEDTNDLGLLLGTVCSEGDVILLEGDLGSG